MNQEKSLQRRPGSTSWPERGYFYILLACIEMNLLLAVDAAYFSFGSNWSSHIMPHCVLTSNKTNNMNI